MKKERIAALLLCGTLMCSSGTAWAAETGVVETTSAAAEEEPAALPDSILYYGRIQSIQRDESGTITHVWMESEADGPLVLLVNEDTAYIDAGQHCSSTADAILQEGAGVYVFHSPVMLMSYPGQTGAFVFVGNMPMDMRCPMYHTIEEVEPLDDGGVRVLTDQGGLWITVPKDASVIPYLTDQILTPASLQKGDRIMAWYDAVAESYPAQTQAAHVVVLPQLSTELQVQTVTETVVQAGETSWTAEMQGEVLVTPVRTAAEALGCTVTYEQNADGEWITIRRDTQSLRLKAGSATAVWQDGEAVSDYALEQAVTIEAPGVTWAPLSIFSAFGAVMTQGEGSVTIALPQ